VALRRSILNNSVSGLCVTKLDVLDGLDSIRLCVGYRCGSERLDHAPLGAEALAVCEPLYEEMPGWPESTIGVRRYEDLPVNARNYLRRVEELSDTPIDIISTGPDRADTIVLRDPFAG
jgi:adenylosuccinate synthase